MFDFTDYATITELTEDHIHTMFTDQALTTASSLHAAAVDGYTDSRFDYLSAALELANVMLQADYETDSFTLDQLRLHVAHICYDSVSPVMLAMLFDDCDHYNRIAAIDAPAAWDFVNPNTWR